MPKATLPSTVRGWVVAMLASFIGFIIGFWITNALGGVLSG
jgi:hypothetical protein